MRASERLAALLHAWSLEKEIGRCQAAASSQQGLRWGLWCCSCGCVATHREAGWLLLLLDMMLVGPSLKAALHMCMRLLLHD